MTLETRSEAVLARLNALRDLDAPTHGGRVLSYVYDSGLGALDDLAARAARAVQSVNGLDPTVFPSAGVIESELVAFGRNIFHGDDEVVGNVTSGGTESCILAVLGARDSVGPGAGSIVMPITAHAAFHKAAHLTGLEAITVSVDALTGLPRAEDFAEAIRDDTVLVVVSAPSYPFAALDPIEDVAALAAQRGIACHVDACIGGLALPWWPDLPSWDFAVPGVTSLSADLHKYGYSPKGASLLLTRGRDRHRHQYFGITDWPGYPVVNPTLLGSRSVTAMAAAWAIVSVLGETGFASLVDGMYDATVRLVDTIRSIDGLRVVGEPVGPLFAVASSGTGGIDPHRWMNAVAARGFSLQGQPALDEHGLPRTTHLTITPATVGVLDELVDALLGAADDARGLGPVDPPPALTQLGGLFRDGAITSEQALALSSDEIYAVLTGAGLDPRTQGGAMDMAAVLGGVEQLPRDVGARMLIEYLARIVEP